MDLKIIKRHQCYLERPNAAEIELKKQFQPRLTII